MDYITVNGTDHRVEWEELGLEFAHMAEIPDCLCGESLCDYGRRPSTYQNGPGGEAAVVCDYCDRHYPVEHRPDVPRTATEFAALVIGGAKVTVRDGERTAAVDRVE